MDNMYISRYFVYIIYIHTYKYYIYIEYIYIYIYKYISLFISDARHTECLNLTKAR